jgi:Zn-finger nucleic acid-binding protein
VDAEKTPRKVNVKAFLRDFTGGSSDPELRDKFQLSSSELARLVSKLKNEGLMVPGDVAAREENLRIRFGSRQGPPEPVTESGLPVDLDTGVVLHCPACGAAIRRGASHCEYCEASLDFNAKGKTIPCPHCFGNSPADSRFCVRCGKPVKGLVQEGKVMEDRVCPRCQVPMHAKEIGDFSVAGCSQCQGLFVPNETFEMMQEQSDRVIFSVNGIPREPLNADDRVRYVRCPVCRNLMNRTNFAHVSGVIIDTCRPHGIWFDADELEKIMDFIARGGLQKARQRDAEERKAEEEREKIRHIPTGPTESDYNLSWGHRNEVGTTLDMVDVISRLFGVLKH